MTAQALMLPGFEPRPRRHVEFKRLDAAPLLSMIEVCRPQMTAAQERAYWRAKSRGTVTLGAADALCCSLLGMHPALVFGSAWWKV